MNGCQIYKSGLMDYFWFYDEEHSHQSLDYRTRGEVYRVGMHGENEGALTKIQIA